MKCMKSVQQSQFGKKWFLLNSFKKLLQLHYFQKTQTQTQKNTKQMLFVSCAIFKPDKDLQKKALKRKKVLKKKVLEKNLQQKKLVGVAKKSTETSNIGRNKEKKTFLQKVATKKWFVFSLPTSYLTFCMLNVQKHQLKCNSIIL